ncbi:carboxypeptidase B-like [Cloeon dipterum]|uniref:carboxypeptidase B-like n=1 Tax=Cloeon dipterum TaxID=197152 RepID=UPI0032207D08
MPTRWLLLIVGVALTRAGELQDVKEAQLRYKGAQVLRVEAVKNNVQKDVIKKMQDEQVVDIWQIPAVEGGTQVDIMVPAVSLKQVKATLKNVSATFKVMIQDVGAAIRNQNPVLKEGNNKRMARKGHRMTFQNYHRVSDIHGYLEYLARTFPDLVSVQTIGSSVEGRPLKLIKITGSNADPKPAFYIDGGIHAREWISPTSVTYIIQELVENRDKYKFMDAIDFYIVPVVNPDGYEYTHNGVRLWRKKNTCAGTDLDKNFGYKWDGAGSSHDPCQETYAFRNFVSSLGVSVRAYVTFHSYGQYILYPWGYDKKVPPDYDLDRIGKKAANKMREVAGASYTVGNSASLLYAASGGADDLAKGGSRIKYTYTIQLRDRGQYGFLLPASSIVPTGKEAFAAIQTISEEIAADG